MRIRRPRAAFEKTARRALEAPGAPGQHRRQGICHYQNEQAGACVMSKGMDRKKLDKKKPTRTLKEKRAAKAAKTEQKRFI
ncbi:hypothetical protein ACS8Y6_14180 [Salinisphaera sp. RV14]|uniref:hypothetical protein n=1 Tax=unclassified Salinisphaera TaxID=2649847 RepID=UPI000D7D759B|nr:hypothetical protein SALB1_2040 [Salinisphaera sp. LB1]